MQVSISKTKLKVGLKGADPVLDGELFASVKPDDCYWNITDGKVVELTLQKVGIVLFLAILSSIQADFAALDSLENPQYASKLDQYIF